MLCHCFCFSNQLHHNTQLDSRKAWPFSHPIFDIDESFHKSHGRFTVIQYFETLIETIKIVTLSADWKTYFLFIDSNACWTNNQCSRSVPPSIAILCNRSHVWIRRDSVSSKKTRFGKIQKNGKTGGWAGKQRHVRDEEIDCRNWQICSCSIFSMLRDLQLHLLV